MTLRSIKSLETYRVLILTDREWQNLDLIRAIDEEGFSYRLGYDSGVFLRGQENIGQDAVVLDLEALDPGKINELVARCRESREPVIGALLLEKLQLWEPSLDVDDVVVLPLRPGEIRFRVHRAIAKVKGRNRCKVIGIRDLVIDQERYEVSVGGNKISLPYKEYKLLVLLASTPGRVYGRDALLSQVWEYDYFGGTRTVDVHIRRLRSKIEDADHSFIETVRNVGYRFKA